jgi:hypothetical protein
MELAELALNGPRDDKLMKQAVDCLEPDTSEDETEQSTVEVECLVNNYFNKNSLCFLIKSRGYGDTLTNPLKTAIAIELKVSI